MFRCYRLLVCCTLSLSHAGRNRPNPLLRPLTIKQRKSHPFIVPFTVPLSLFVQTMLTSGKNLARSASPIIFRISFEQHPAQENSECWHLSRRLFCRHHRPGHRHRGDCHGTARKQILKKKIMMIVADGCILPYRPLVAENSYYCNTTRVFYLPNLN